MEAQLEAQKIQLQTQSEIAVAQAKHEMQKEIEQLRILTRNADKGAEQMFRSQLEKQKGDRKDDRVKKQAVEQSKLIAQRKGERAALTEAPKDFDITQLL